MRRGSTLVIFITFLISGALAALARQQITMARIERMSGGREQRERRRIPGF
jgi:hypothetical protein